jgi:hypothetical protein
VATHDDVRRIALSLPATVEGEDSFRFFVLDKGKRKLIAWLWQERVDPKKARVENPTVLVVRVPSEEDKHGLIAASPKKFFTEPHYDGYAAVLIRLAAIGVKELTELIADSWRCQAPKALVREYDGG